MQHKSYSDITNKNTQHIYFIEFLQLNLEKLRGLAVFLWFINNFQKKISS